MTIQDRIKTVRTNAGLTMTAFADILNISLSTVSLMESGERSITNRTKKDICEKFNVNLAWLETGDGEPYSESVTSVIKLLKAEYDLDDLDIQIIEKYLELSPIERQVFKDYVKKIGSAD